MDEGLIVLTCGERSIRLRPALNLTAADADEGLARLHAVLAAMARPAGA